MSTQSVRDRLASAGVDVTARQAQLLVRHAELVLAHNQHVNLTRIVEPQEVLDLHIVDSLAFLSAIEPSKGSWVDIGSGAGFPGIPLAILGFNVVLCESVKKKASFLTSAVEELGLETPVMPVRAEELAAASPAAFDVVIARALSSLPALVELASPLLHPRGCLVAMKGRPEAEERAQAQLVGRIAGMQLRQEASYTLPNGDPRTLFVYERRGSVGIQLPRRPGMAQRHPLGVKDT